MSVSRWGFVRFVRWVAGGGGRERVRGKVDIERRIVRRDGRLRRGGGMVGLSCLLY